MVSTPAKHTSHNGKDAVSPPVSGSPPAGPDQPIAGGERYRGRIGGIDLARALAIIGMYWAHLGFTPESAGIGSWLATIPHGRSAILFALLAGVSVAIMTGRNVPYSAERLRYEQLRITGRAVLLLLFGGLLSMLHTPIAVILGFYGIWFLLALPFARLSVRRLFVLAGTTAVFGPLLQMLILSGMTWAGLGHADAVNMALLESLAWGMYPGLQYMAFVFAGMGVGRLDLTSRIVQGWIVWTGAFLSLLGYGLAWVLTGLFADGDPARLYEFARAQSVTVVPGEWSWPPAVQLLTADPHTGTVLEAIGSGGFTLLVVGLCLLAGGATKHVFYPLVAIGSMALTAYSWHIVAIFFMPELMFSGSFQPFILVLCVTLVFAGLWKMSFTRGPLEWVVYQFAKWFARG